MSTKRTTYSAEFKTKIVIEVAARQGEAKPRWSSPQKGCLSAPLRDCA